MTEKIGPAPELPEHVKLLYTIRGILKNSDAPYKVVDKCVQLVDLLIQEGLRLATRKDAEGVPEENDAKIS